LPFELFSSPPPSVCAQPLQAPFVSSEASLTQFAAILSFPNVPFPLMLPLALTVFIFQQLQPKLWPQGPSKLASFLAQRLSWVVAQLCSDYTFSQSLGPKDGQIL
jgi:hypothetical protein